MRTRFKENLEKRRIPNIAGILESAESDELIAYLNERLNVPVISLFEVTSHKDCEETRSALQNDAELKFNNLFSQTLKYYALFLQDEKAKAEAKAKRSKKKVAQAPVLKLKEMSEGGKIHTEYERRYRNSALRRACIAEYGWVCQVCGFDFSKAYGELGEDFIEVHHLEPISTFEEEHQVDPLTQLVPLCSNCHSMIHHGKSGPLSLREMRGLYKGVKYRIAKLKED